MTRYTPGPWLPTYSELHQLIHGGGEARYNRLLAAAAPDLLEALQEIAKGEGAFSRDPLEHCYNTVDSMKSIARAAIKAAT